MPIINIKFKNPTATDRSYKIFIQKGCINILPSFLKKSKLADKYAIITDDKIRKIFGNTLLRYLKKNKIEADIISFEAGEKSKRTNTVEKLAEELVKKGFTKKTAILTLGGGVTGDIAGFLASIYFRGIPYIHIPTSLLAMVDSSIGGKTGVDLALGKNLLGTIMQPKAVFIDTNYLKTLPDKQIRNGLAEIIKYGIIADPKLFKFIEQNIEKILSRNNQTLNYIIKKSVENKAKIIQKDENDKKHRMILNYGHTFGHALEKMSGYKLLHGYAVSIGMIIANKIAVEKGYLAKKDAERIKNLLKNIGLPVTTIKKLTYKDIASDKKRIGKYINLILPVKIGKTIIYKEKCLK